MSEEMMNEEMESFLRGVVGAVEATSYEALCIWRECTEELKMPWREPASGLMEIVGTIADLPVCISLFTPTVDGHKLLFWHATSRAVDHEMIEEWLQKNLPNTAREADGRLNRTDAMNFHNVLHAARRMVSIAA